MSSEDSMTATRVPHRALLEIRDRRTLATDGLRNALSRHHTSEDQLRQSGALIEAMRRLGLSPSARLSRFPTNPNTRKGNLAEVVLAEYVAAAARLTVPVYRLRYNPNVNESMKGDDVLAFDLESEPARVVVGEAKFRGAPTRSAVVEIVQALVRSHRGGIPTSLQFVADRLFEVGNGELATRVRNCALLFAGDRLRIDYVGLMLSDDRASAYVANETPAMLRHLLMISLGVADPDGFASECYEGLE
jgi:hypothetical protein